MAKAVAESSVNYSHQVTESPGLVAELSVAKWH